MKLSVITITAAAIIGAMMMKPKKTWATPDKGLPFEDAFKMATQYNNLPDGLLSRMAYQESRYNPTAVSPAGAKGIMQFMPGTWAEWGNGYDIFDPLAQIAAAGRYMRWLYDRLGSWELALAAYNWGIGNVQRKGVENAPIETRNYVAQIGGAVGVV